MANNKIYLVALDDNDSEAYESECIPTTLEDAFTNSLKLLITHDHVCMVDESDYTTLKALSHKDTTLTYTALAPHSINLSAGYLSKTQNEIL